MVCPPFLQKLHWMHSSVLWLLRLHLMQYFLIVLFCVFGMIEEDSGKLGCFMGKGAGSAKASGLFSGALLDRISRSRRRSSNEVSFCTVKYLP